MAKVKSIVFELDDGRYRTVDFARIRCIYVDGSPPDAIIHSSGDGGLISRPSDLPDWEWPHDTKSMLSGSGNLEDGNGDPPVCYWVDGVLICNGEPGG